MAAHLSAVMDLLAPLRVPGRTEQLALRDALGRGLAADVTAPVSLPPFANSQMDGFAVNSAVHSRRRRGAACGCPRPGRCHAGAAGAGHSRPDHDRCHDPGRCGRRRPRGRAVPDRFPDPGTDTTVWLPATAAGTFVRSVGSDLAAGERALAAGTFLGPAQLGLLAGLGIADVTVYKALTVLLVTTGDEVVEPGQDLPAGKIYNSNGTLLESAMRQAGLKVVRTRIATDSPGELRRC